MMSPSPLSHAHQSPLSKVDPTAPLNPKDRLDSAMRALELLSESRNPRVSNAMNALSTNGTGRATAAAGLDAANRMHDLFSGLNGAMLTQGQPGGSSNELLEQFFEMLTSVIDVSKIEDISMVQKGNVLVVVITMQEGHKLDNNPVPSTGLDEHVSNLKGLDASTQEGFDKVLDVAKNGMEASLEAIKTLQKVLEMLREEDRKAREILENVAKEQGLGISAVTQDTASQFASAVGSELGKTNG